MLLLTTSYNGLSCDLPTTTSIVGVDVLVNASDSIFSSTLEWQVCEDHCDGAYNEPFTKSNDDAMDGLSLMSRGVC